MEPNAKYTVVGILMLALVSAMVIGILWLRRSGGRERMELYTIYFRQQSLSGLQEDSYVTMRGIKIGSVASVKIEPADIERVKVVVRIQAGTPVKTDTRAVIQRNLLTGLSMIDLVGSTQHAPLLEANEPGERRPVIREGQTEFQALQNTVPDLLNRTNLLLGQVASLFSDENRKAFDKIIGNFQTISDRIVASEGDIHDTLLEISKLAQTTRGLTEELRKRVAEVSGATVSMTDRISHEASAISGDVNTLTDKFSRTLDQYQEPRSIISGVPEWSLGPGEEPP